MTDTDVLAVVGTCAPERAQYAMRLASAARRSLFTANRLSLAADPIDEALALAPWANLAPSTGALVEFPSDTRVTELVGALASEDGGIRLTGLVCVVDAMHLLDDLHVESYAARRLFPADGPPAVEHTAHAMLTVTQMEFASQIVMVNWEGLATADLSTVMALVSHLSPRARLRLEHGAIAVPEPCAGYSAVQERPGWVAVLNGEHDPHMTDRRVRAIRYEQVRPLHPGRLQALLDDRVEPGEFGTVIRSAGFCRIATRPRVVGEWDHVGRMFSLEPLAHDGGGELLAVGQDLAFIGLDLDIAGLSAALDEAALSDDELAAGPEAWRRFPDPFPAWQTAEAG